MQHNIYIICGPSGAGKWTTCDYLARKMNGLIWRPSDLTREVLREFSIADTRENLSKMMHILRNRFTPDIYVYAAKEYIEKHHDTPIFFDGIRKIHFIKRLQESYDCKIIFLDATLRIRYDRLTDRWDKSWESEMSYEQFLSDENLESEKENNTIRELADMVIENNSTKDELFGQIDTYIMKNA